MDGRGSGRWLELVAVAGAYALLTLAATWPLARHFGTHSPGVDSWGARQVFFETPVNLWNLWWFRYALVDLGQSPFSCPYIFYPHGANLWLHTLAPLYGVAGIILQSVMSLAAALNAIIVINLTAAGTASYYLARSLGLRSPGAFVAGIIFAFSPAVFAHVYVGHVELLATCWMPLALLLGVRLMSRPSPRWSDAIGLGLVLVGAAYTAQYYLVYSLELLAVGVVAYGRDAWREVVFTRFGVAAGVALVGVGPLVWSVFSSGDGGADVAAEVFFDHYAGDLASYVVPSFTNPLASVFLRDLHEALRPGALHLPQETTVFLGLSVVAMACWGLARRPYTHALLTRLAVAVAVVFWILSMGAHLRVAGTETGIPLPAYVLSKIPVLNLTRAPGRHVIVAMLGLGLLAGMGWESMRRSWMRVAAGALLVAEYAAVPVPLFSTQVATVYERLRTVSVPGEFAVLDVPVGVRDGRTRLGNPDGRDIFAQTVHHRPIVTGMVSRLPAERWQAITKAPVIGTLLHPTGATRRAFANDAQHGAAYFERWKIRAVVVHPAARGGPAQQYIERVLPIARRESFPDGFELLWLGPDSNPAM